MLLAEKNQATPRATFDIKKLDNILETLLLGVILTTTIRLIPFKFRANILQLFYI